MPSFRLFSRPLSPSTRHNLRVLVVSLQTFFAGHLFFDRVYSAVPLGGPSMLPTFEVTNDWVLVSRWYRQGRGVQVGDVVTFDSVIDTRERVVKRIVGMEGDFVLRDAPGGTGEMVQIPKGHCWAVGDNLDASRDSRLWGPMPMALIKGKIVAKILPYAERKWIDNNVVNPSE